MRIRLGRSALVAAAAVAMVVPVSAASSASAVSPKVRSGPPSYVPLRNAARTNGPLDTAFGNMDYNGGPVMPSNTDYMVLWSPGGSGAYGPPEYVSGLKQYFKDLAHDSGGNQNVDSVSTQYNDSTGASRSMP